MMKRRLMKPIQHTSFFALLALSAAACSAGSSAAADQAAATGQKSTASTSTEAKADAAQASPDGVAKDVAAQKATASAGEVINGIAIVPGVERLSYISPRYYGIRESYDACLDKTQGQIPARGDCADDEFDYQDARLNKTYRALLATLGTGEGDAKSATAPVQAAQRAWLAFYEKDCSARADRFGSDAAPAMLSICRMESVARRAQELEDWRDSYVGSHRP
jgi:uncharacterized protein YecT (DUF1311 family)